MSRLIALSPVHAALMAGMHRICFAEPWDEAAMAGLLAMPGVFGLLAGGERSDSPQGFILCRKAADEAEVLTLLVLPPYRRSGVGGRLLEAAWLQVGAAGMFLEVAADNAAGLALYSSHGFVPVGRRPRYYSGRTDALVLRRT